MIDLGLNQYKIKEIKYEVKEGKTVIFKLNNFNLEDVTIETNGKKIEQSEDCKSDGKKQYDEFSLDDLNKYGPAKHLDDYKPETIFKGEKGMQETLEASRHKNWRENFKENPPKNVDCLNTSEDKKYPLCATKEELMDFYKVQKVKNLKQDKEFRDKYEKKLANDLVKSKKLIDDYTTKMTKVEKERFLDRAKNNYFKLDPNDTFSNIKSLSDLNSLNANYSSLTSDEAEMKPISDTKTNNRDEEGSDKIIKAFKQED
jgi:hypothetical protein